MYFNGQVNKLKVKQRNYTNLNRGGKKTKKYKQSPDDLWENIKQSNIKHTSNWSLRKKGENTAGKSF